MHQASIPEAPRPTIPGQPSPYVYELESEISMSLIGDDASSVQTSSAFRPADARVHHRSSSVVRRFFPFLRSRRNRHPTPADMATTSDGNNAQHGESRDQLGDKPPTPTATSNKNAIINAEPAIFFFSVAFGILIGFQNLFLYWARCVEIFTERPVSTFENVTTLCTDLSTNNDSSLLDDVEADIAKTRIYIQIVSTGTTLISAPIIGALSDGKAGRRKPMLVCLFALIVYCALHTTAIAFYEKINVYYFLLTAETFAGCLGGLASVFTLSMAIVTDDCRNEDSITSSGIPLRIAISCAIQALGVTLGSLCVTVLSVPPEISTIRHVQGYMNMALVALLCSVASFIYTVVFVKDSYAIKEAATIVLPPPNNVQTGHYARLKHFGFELVEVLIEKRPGWTRLCMNLCIFFLFTDILANDPSMLMLITKRQPFDWSDNTFSKFYLMRTMLVTVGMVIIPAIMSRATFVGADSFLVMVGLCAAMLMSLMLAFAQTSEAVFASAFFALIGGAIGPGYRSMLPKMVPPHHTARLFSIMSLMMVICPLVSASIFNNIYAATMETWPGFVFFVYACIHFTVMMGQFVIHFLMMPQWRLQHSLDTIGIENDHQRLLEAGDEEVYRGLTPIIDDDNDANSVTARQSTSSSDAENARIPRGPEL
uniref:MFS domain-containing protein n=1 Tax=Panagrellus redivivus TaxID=6233 RepID=A0A7E4VI35_PANRE